MIINYDKHLQAAVKSAVPCVSSIAPAVSANSSSCSRNRIVCIHKQWERVKSCKGVC